MQSQQHAGVDNVFSPLHIRLYIAAAVSMIELFMLYSLPLANWLITSAAIAWLFHRANKVFSRPVDDLVKILGIEVPDSPSTSLSEIRTDGFVIHWKVPEQRASIVKYLVQVNGIIIGEISNQEAAANISGLQHGKHYAVRVIAVNTSNFQASSEVMRLKTFLGGDVDSAEDDAHQLAISSAQKTSSPKVRPFKQVHDANVLAPAATAMTREHSNSHSHFIRKVPPRKPGTSVTEQHTTSGTSGSEHSPIAGSVIQLTEKLDGLRRAIMEAEKQEEEEEEDFRSCQATLTEKKDFMRQQLKDREDESKELRKNVQSLERQNIAVQSKKTAQERLLGQKFGEREKMRDDIKRWDLEAETAGPELGRKEDRKRAYLEDGQQKIQDLRDQQTEATQAMKSLEEEVREKGILIKDLEDEKVRIENEANDTDPINRHIREAEEDRTWQENLNSLQTRYNTLYQEVRHAEYMCQQVQQQLEYFRNQANLLSAFSSDSHSIGRESPHNTHVSTNRTYSAPSAYFNSAGFGSSDMLPISNSATARNHLVSSTGFDGSSFPFDDGPVLSSGGDPSRLGASKSDAEKLTSSAMISPTAGALLPAGLFIDEAEDPATHASNEDVDSPVEASNVTKKSAKINAPAVLPGLWAIPGLGSVETRTTSGQTNTSPGGFASRSPSVVSSPRESTINVHQNHQQHSIGYFDVDGRSIRSASSASISQRGPSRFAEFLNFNRQRGKTLSNEGPALGSLKASQSQSMPRQGEHDQNGIDSSDGPRKRASNAAGFFGHLSNALSRKGKNVDDGRSASIDPASMGLFSGFATGDSIWSTHALPSDGPPSPVSLYSTENLLRPASEAGSKGWLIDPSRLGGSRLAGLPPATPWSKQPSRRQSVHDGVSDNLLDGTPEFGPDSQDLRSGTRSPPQAPIGTRPSKRSKLSMSSKQLNPNATVFEIRNMFKKRDKLSANGDDGRDSVDDLSPTESRKSKEERPQSATDSMEDYADNQSNSGVATPSDNTPQTTPGTRESFIKKIARKGSSNKVNIPFFKDKANKKGSDPEGTPDETDEDIGAGQLGRSVESISSSPHATLKDRSSVLSWSSFRKWPKKGNDTPSIDEASQASETGEEDEHSIDE